jgi:hypothetical protein
LVARVRSLGACGRFLLIVSPSDEDCDDRRVD